MTIIDGFADIIDVTTIAPGLDGALRMIKTCTGLGIKVNMGHTNATFAEAEAGFHSGAKGITHLFNAMRPYHHREPGIAGFGLLNPHVYVELIADPFHLHPATLKMVFRLKDPAKILIVSDSVRETGTARHMEPKPMLGERGVLQGGAMTVAEGAARLIESGFDQDTVMAGVSVNPDTYLTT